METKKSKSANLENKKFQFLQLGLLLALSMSLCAFEWLDADYKPDYINASIVEDNTIEPVFEATLLLNKPKPPSVSKSPKKSEFVKVTPEIYQSKEEDKTEFEEVDESEFLDEPEKEVKIPNTVKVKKNNSVVSSALLRLNGIIPHYKECSQLSGDRMFNCVSEELGYYLMEEIEVPESINYTGPQRPVVTFVVDENGKITDPIIIKEKEYSRDLVDELKRAFLALPPMIPGFQGDSPVKVRFNIPIRIVAN